MATTDETDEPVREVAIGDEFIAVVVHPNLDDSRDPVTKVNGTTTFLRFPDKEVPPIETGDVIRARMADKQAHNSLAIALDWGESVAAVQGGDGDA